MSGKKRLIVAAIAVLAVIGALWLTNRAVTPKEATQDDIRTEARMGGYRLVDTATLAQWYRQDKKLLIVDTRQDWEYRAGHINGALNFPMEPTWWSRWSKEDELAKFLGEDKDKLLVFYWAGLTWVRSDSAARVAVQLGYKNVYRDPLGYPEWKDKGLPTASAPLAPGFSAQAPEGSGPLFGWAIMGTLLAIFLGGLALNLTPCVYPLIPITVSYFGGRSGESRGSTLTHGLLYLAGLVLVNSVLGVTAALTGGLMGAALQSPLVLVVVAAVLAAFALSMFGLWELKLPSFLTQAASKSHAGYFGSLFMGLTLGVVAAPCIGPFILGLLTWVASLGSPWLGFIVFFTLSLGLGLPLFVLAMFSGKLDKLPRSGEWMLWVRKLMGWVLLGMAAYFIGPLLPHGFRYLLLAAVALAGAVHLGWLERSQATFKGFQWLRTLTALAGLVLATYLAGTWLLMGPGVNWSPYSDELLTRARLEGKPVIIDFYADWCAPCRQLEDITLHDKQVVELANQHFQMIKVDLTTKDEQRHPRLLSEYKVRGVPTVVFIDAKGQRRPGLRLVDFLPADQFILRMKKTMEPLSPKND